MGSPVAGGAGEATLGALPSAGAGASLGVLEQAASAHRIATLAPSRPWRNVVMWVILLEALGALVLLVLIVWWIMFSGRRKGERKGHHDSTP
jgi:hypothetical protein